MKRPVAIGAAAALAAALLWLIAPGNDSQRIAQGQALYATHCASCHGKQLEGQPDWQTPLPNGRLPAPPHDAKGHSWHHADEALIGITKFGLKPFAGEDYESDMPAFGTKLRDREIAAIIGYIKSTWPARELEYQERITRNAASSGSQ